MHLSPLLFLAIVATQAKAENTGNTRQPLTSETSAVLWTEAGNTVPVCWEDAGYEREKKIVETAVANTWSYHASIDFVGWGSCPTSGEARHVRIRVTPYIGTDNDGAGGSAYVGMRALSKASDNDPGVNFSFKTDGTAGQNRVEYVGVHEFGHVLGFVHEQDADDNEGPGQCDDTVDPAVDPAVITGYDRDSIMNYCNRDLNGTGILSDRDVLGVQQTYGVRRANVAPTNGCASAPIALRTSLAGAWNDYGLTSVAMFQVAGASFQRAVQWSVRQGGWGDTVKWASGWFDDDRSTDLAAAWNNGGVTALTMRLSTGSGFSTSHWLANAGGWSDTSQLLAGDFNGDGLTDLAMTWNDGGMTSVAVYKSTGTSFLPPEQWALRDGGWDDRVKWMAGDFDGNGRIDLAAAWENDGRTVLTVRRSTGRRFAAAHWSLDAGRWFDSSTFVAGDFDQNGRADIAQLWNDVGDLSVRVSLSNGAAFLAPTAWATRQGGWTPFAKFIPGDFDGDGHTDIAAAWNDAGSNTLTMRSSDGATFQTSHWSRSNGGWLGTTAWCSGSFH